MKDNTTTFILLGGLAIGGYLLYNWIKNSPLVKAGETITNTIEKITHTETQTVTPIGIPTGTAFDTKLTSPSILNFLIPPTGIPGFINYLQEGRKWTVGSTAGIISQTATALFGSKTVPKQTVKTALAPVQYVKPTPATYPLISKVVTTPQPKPVAGKTISSPFATQAGKTRAGSSLLIGLQQQGYTVPTVRASLQKATALKLTYK